MRKKLVDKIDLAIINCLQSDAKMSNRELSKEVGLTPPPTLERVNKLWKAVLLTGVRAKIDYGKFQFKHLAVLYISIANNSTDQFTANVRENRYITSCVELADLKPAASSKRYMVTILTRSGKELRKVLMSVTKGITVHDLSLYNVKQIHKDQPLAFNHSDLETKG